LFVAGLEAAQAVQIGVLQQMVLISQAWVSLTHYSRTC